MLHYAPSHFAECDSNIEGHELFHPAGGKLTPDLEPVSTLKYSTGTQKDSFASYIHKSVTGSVALPRNEL